MGQMGWYCIGGLFMLIFALLTVLRTLGTYKLFRLNDILLPQVTVDGTPKQIEAAQARARTKTFDAVVNEA